MIRFILPYFLGAASVIFAIAFGVFLADRKYTEDDMRTVKGYYQEQINELQRELDEAKGRGMTE